MTRLAFSLALLAATAFAGEADLLRKDIADLQFLNSLDLTRDQVRAILPFAEKGALLNRQFESERDWLTVKLHAALERFKEEDLRDEGLSDEVMAAAGGLDHALKTMGNRVAAAMEPLEQAAARHFNARQRARVFPATQTGHPLDLLRSRRGSDFRELRDRLARDLANARVKAGVIGRYERRSERLRLERLLQQTKDWEDGVYRAKREELLTTLVPGYERNKIAAAIRAIYRARYGKAGPLSDHVFRERMLEVLAERAGVPAPKLPPRPRTGRSLPGDLDRIRKEVAELRADINLLNLMNGLHLESDQVKTIRKGAKSCAGARPAVEELDERTEVKALREIRTALRRCEAPPLGAVSRLQSPLARRGSGYAAAKRKEYLEVHCRAVDELFERLDPTQLDVIRTYKACLVPPKDLRDPVRVGQANDNSAMERLVDQLRRVPLDDNADAVMDRILERIESREGRFPAEERHCKLMMLVGVAYEAQRLDDAGFAARRSELAERLKPLNRLDTLKDRLHEMQGAETVIRHKIGAFLLDPRMVPLSESRLELLAKPRKIDRPKNLPKADICEEGECGKP